MNLMYVLIGSLVFNGVFVILYAFYPGALKLALARLMGKKLVITLGKDRVLRFKAASKVGEFFKTKDSIYEMEPEDALSYNGCAGGLWYESYNRAANPDVLPYITHLKKAGFDTVNDVNLLLSSNEEDLLKEEGGEELVKLKKKLEDGYILKVAEVIRLRDLYGYLKARNPMAIQGYTEREVAKERYKHNNPLQQYFPYAVMAAIIIFALAIGANMMETGAGSGVGNALEGATSSMTIK